MNQQESPSGAGTAAGEGVPPEGVLYTFRRCPYAIRARMALASVGDAAIQALQVREVVLRDKPQAMLALSPAGTVPVLALAKGAAGDGGQVLAESLDIMHFALSRGREADARALESEAASELVAHNDGPFKAALDRYKYANRYVEKDAVDALQEDAYRACGEFLQPLEARLDTHAHLLGPSPTPLDWAIFPFVRQFGGVEPERFKANYPRLADWKDRHQASALFRQVMPKLSPWRPGDTPIRFDAAYPPPTDSP